MTEAMQVALSGDYIMRCTRCNHVIRESPSDSLDCCPSCGTRSIPLGPEHDVWLRINWQELRVLVHWAERWASANDKENTDMMDAVYAIVSRIQEQYPERQGLTFRSELSGLRDYLAKKSPASTVEQNVITEKEDLQLPPPLEGQSP